SSRRRHTRFSRDWSSDVCSSDLALEGVADHLRGVLEVGLAAEAEHLAAAGGELVAQVLGDVRGRLDRVDAVEDRLDRGQAGGVEIGRASCRERVWSGGASGAGGG